MKKIKLRDATDRQFTEWEQSECSKTYKRTGKVHCPFPKTLDCDKELCPWTYCRHMYSDEFLDQEIEVEE